MIEKRYFQYVAGDNVGEIKTLKGAICEDGITYLEFTDGELMNRDYVAPITNRRADLKHKMMVEISSRDNAWTIEDIKERTVKLGDDKYAKHVPPIEDYIGMSGSGENTTVDSRIGGKRLVPPKHKVEPKPLPTAKEETFSGATEEEIREAYGSSASSTTLKNESTDIDSQNIEEAVVVEDVPNKVEPKKEEVKKQVVEQQKPQPASQLVKKSSLDATDPVAILVGSSKKAEYELPVTLTIQLPQKSLYNIVAEQFDGGREKFIQYILDSLDISEVIKSIGEALKVSYES